MLCCSIAGVSSPEMVGGAGADLRVHAGGGRFVLAGAVHLVVFRAGVRKTRISFPIFPFCAKKIILPRQADRLRTNIGKAALKKRCVFLQGAALALED
eukprot:COSAG06_NODE_167_length_21546_cov_35.001352_42_plen_98_part_00